MMIALSIVARLTSLSVTAPTPRWMIRSCTESSTSIFMSDSSSASTAPDTSPLMMRLSDSTLPSSSARVKSSRLMRLRALASWALRSTASRFSAICRAVRSSSVTRKVSPAPGTDERPWTWTGREG